MAMGLVLEKSATAYGLGTPGSFVTHKSMHLIIKFVFPELPRRTKQTRNENRRDQRAVKTNFAACPRPLWVKVVRLPGLADGEDVADWIPRVVGDRVGDEA